jgi:hypothetical protein
MYKISDTCLSASAGRGAYITASLGRVTDFRRAVVASPARVTVAGPFEAVAVPTAVIVRFQACKYAWIVTHKCVVGALHCICTQARASSNIVILCMAQRTSFKLYAPDIQSSTKRNLSNRMFHVADISAAFRKFTCVLTSCKQKCYCGGVQLSHTMRKEALL